jgi:hypothetical protein
MAAAACAIKLKEHGHPQPAELAYEGSYSGTISVDWTDPDPRTRASLGEKATEFAGECLGILLSEQLTEFNVVERSFIGTGFDFWLGKKRDLLFQRKARLETSAMDRGANSDVDARVRRKQLQVTRGTRSSFGASVIIVSNLREAFAKVVRDA